MSHTIPWTLYKAIVIGGQNVCVDARYLDRTSRVVRSEREYDDARDEGWHDRPQDAVAALEAEQTAAFTHVAERAYDDRHLSDKAKHEADEVDRTSGFTPLADIPEAPKKGRTKKGG